MGTVAQVIKSEWFTQFKNGDNYNLLPLDTTNNLIGSIFENVKLRMTMRMFTFQDMKDFYLTSDSIQMSGAAFNNIINVGDRCRIVFRWEYRHRLHFYCNICNI